MVAGNQPNHVTRNVTSPRKHMDNWNAYKTREINAEHVTKRSTNETTNETFGCQIRNSQKLSKYMCECYATLCCDI